MAFSIPWESLFGGMLLGLSATVLMLFSGKIAGISGVIGGLLNPKKHESSWRAAFLMGMFLSGAILIPFGISLPEIVESNLLPISIAGVLVGIGTRLANGCTSGHGIIGMGRFSARSIAATCVFMLSAIIVVWIKRQLGAM